MRARLLLVISSLALSLLVVELLLALFVPQEIKRLAIYDKDLGWRGRPRGGGVYRYLRDRIEVPFRYNEDGFRTESFIKRDRVDTSVVLLGDSITEGLEVKYDSTFQTRVRTELQRAFTNGVEVFTLASGGYSTAQEILALRKYRSVLRPDIVVLVLFAGNDFTDNLRPAFASLDEHGKLVLHGPRDSWFKVQAASFERWLYEHSHLVFFVKNVIQSVTHQSFIPATKRESHQGPDYMYRLTTALILAARDDVEGGNAQFGIVIMPSKDEASGASERIDFLVNVCRDNAISCLDLRTALTPDDYFRHDPHLNASGHSTTGSRMFDFVLSSFCICKDTEARSSSPTR